ncbi:MloA [Serinicoccus hydrothermalis]|uniref:MloA n=1 Tax=Serinicoccus hydrothermalis TaxID=1758689 RepID=A0A1B1NDJ2_9MICO|nr:MloA [Serinicoccus hydrothermalis]
MERVLTTSSPDLQDASMREVLNYLDVAERAFSLLEGGRSLTASHLEDLQGVLMLGTRHAADDSGRIRTVQVVVGRRASADPQALPVAAARFVPPPPGADLRIRVDELLTWMQAAHADIDPVVAAAMSHYTFEALHPFHDGNGRLGRLLIVLSLAWTGTLREPTLSVSPWFEARRQEYYDRLLAVSTEGDWSGWVRFFADGLAATAAQTESRMMALVVVRDHLRDLIRDSPLRSARAYDVVDVALAATTVSVADVSRELGITRSAAKKLIDNLVGIDVLAPVHGRNYNRHYYAPMVLDVLRRG